MTGNWRMGHLAGSSGQGKGGGICDEGSHQSAVRRPGPGSLPRAGEPTLGDRRLRGLASFTYTPLQAKNLGGCL